METHQAWFEVTQQIWNKMEYKPKATFQREQSTTDPQDATTYQHLHPTKITYGENDNLLWTH